MRRKPTVARPFWLYERRFKCKICGYVGKTWSKVANHILREHPPKKYQYPVYTYLRQNIEYVKVEGTRKR